MAEAVYVLCGLTSLFCAVLLIRSFRRQRSRLLMWASLSFVGLAGGNAVLVVDLMVVPEVGVLAALFFLRYWRTAHDRFFLWFAGAFASFGVSWALLAYDTGASEDTLLIYGIRMFGFLQILAAILLKNRHRQT